MQFNTIIQLVFVRKVQSQTSRTNQASGYGPSRYRTYNIDLYIHLAASEVVEPEYTTLHILPAVPGWPEISPQHSHARSRAVSDTVHNADRKSYNQLYSWIPQLLNRHFGEETQCLTATRHTGNKLPPAAPYWLQVQRRTELHPSERPICAAKRPKPRSRTLTDSTEVKAEVAGTRLECAFRVNTVVRKHRAGQLHAGVKRADASHMALTSIVRLHLPSVQTCHRRKISAIHRSG
eukprot:2119635-Pleurochrysis_carterae.AAC.5